MYEIQKSLNGADDRFHAPDDDMEELRAQNESLIGSELTANGYVDIDGYLFAQKHKP